MSFFARAAAASFIRRRGHCLSSGISSSPSSCSMLWRRAITSNSISGENPNYHHHHHQQCPNPNTNSKQAPWLLLSSPTNPQSRYLYDLTIGVRPRDRDDVVDDDDQEVEIFDKKLNRELHLPDIAERIFIGSSQGFLISINIAPYLKTSTIHIFNPLTGSHLPIPRQSPYPSHPYYRDDGLHMSMKWKTPIESIHVDPTFLNLYGTKAILSPSLDTMIILSNPNSEPHASVFSPLSFSFSFSFSSSLGWTKLSCWYLDEGIFHKSLFHATDSIGTLLIFDDLKPKNNKLAVIPLSPLSRQPFLRNSLVESPDGDDLFLVYRNIDDDMWNDPYPCHHISVYKLRFNQKKKKLEWDQVKSIGDLAFFVGTKSSSLSLDVSDRHLFPSLKPNSIYFSDTWPFEDDSLEQKMISKAGVFSLEDKTFHYIELSDTGHCQLNWPPPVWYMPTTPAMQD